jgi:hypothetical protein
MRIKVLGIACFAAMVSHARAAPLRPSLEDRYIAARDAAIERMQPIYDAGNADDAANKAEDAARVGRYWQRRWKNSGRSAFAQQLVDAALQLPLLYFALAQPLLEVGDG